MWADVYVLAPERSVFLIDQFLNRFLPLRKPAAANYLVPQSDDHSEMVFTDAAELMRLCETRPELSHAVYWNTINKFGEPRAAHVFFLSDGGLVLGMSTANRKPRNCDRLLRELKAFVGSDLGYVTGETPPGDNITEFKRVAEEYELHHPFD